VHITLMRAMWWLINLYMFFASCVKGMAQIWNLIIMKKFNEGIAWMVTSSNWCGLNKYTKFICIIYSKGCRDEMKLSIHLSVISHPYVSSSIRTDAAMSSALFKIEAYGLPRDMPTAGLLEKWVTRIPFRKCLKATGSV